MGTGYWAMVIAAAVFLLELIIGIVVGVWVVGKIQSSTERLAATIDHLANNVNRQQEWLDTLEDKVQAHGERVAVLEAQAGATADLTKATAELAKTLSDKTQEEG